MDSVATVSRETSPAPFPGRVLHPVERATTRKGEATRKALVDAVVALVAEGNLRPSALQITRRARRTHSAVSAFCGGLHMLQRLAARTRTMELAVALKLSGWLSDAERERMVWLIVAGVEKPR